MVFGLTIEKILLIGLVAALILGPERLPRYAEAFAGLARRARGFADAARARVRAETDGELDDFDWRTLDPRQYDPRRIVREALLEDARQPRSGSTTRSSAVGAVAAPPTSSPSLPWHAGGVTPPYDTEAT